MTLLAETMPEVLRPESSRRPRSAIVVPAVLLLVAMVGAVFSPGSFDFDEVLHFLHSQRVWQEPSVLLSIWGRLGCTAYFAPAAPLGLMAARLMAVVATAIVGWGAVRLMSYFVPGDGGGWFVRHRVAMVWLLLFAQPCFALFSFSVMSEMLLAGLWVWAAVVMLADRSRVRALMMAGLLMGLGGLMRPEGWVAMACWPMMALIWMRRGNERWGRAVLVAAGSTFLAGLPTLLWYVAGVMTFGGWKWVIDYWPWAPESPYGKTGLLFLFSAGLSMFWWMWAPIVVATRQIFWWPRSMAVRGKQLEAILLLVVPVAGLFVMHGVLGTFGLFGSLSLPRYFISVAPMAATLALMGLIWWEKRRGAKFGLGRWMVGGAAIAPMVLMMALGFLPTMKTVAQHRMDTAIAEVRERVPAAEAEGRIIGDHPYVLYAMGLPLNGKSDARCWPAERFREAGPGTILIVDESLWSGSRRPSLQTLGFEEDAALKAKVNASSAGPWWSRYFETVRVSVWVKK